MTNTELLARAAGFRLALMSMGMYPYSDSDYFTAYGWSGSVVTACHECYGEEDSI